MAARGTTIGRLTNFEKKMRLDWSHCGKHQTTSGPSSSEVEYPREEKEGTPQKQLETGLKLNESS